MNYPVTAKAFIYKSELEYISKCVLDFPNIETGGDLFGFWTHTGCPVIQYVIGPGKKANHQVAFFNQELEYLNNYGVLLREAHALQHIGQWHSHHQLGLPEPSQHDISTVCRAISLYNLNQFFLVITNIDGQASGINGFLFRKEKNREFNFTGWEVLEGESPVRKLIDNKYPDLVSVPKTTEPLISNLVTSNTEVPLILKINYDLNYWLTDKSNHLILKQITDRLSFFFNDVKVFFDDNTNFIFLELKHKRGCFRLYFTDNFPMENPVVKFLHKGIYKTVISDRAVWQTDIDIVSRTESFIKNFIEIRIRKKQLLHITPVK